MTGLEVGGWFVSGFIEKFVGELSIYIRDQYKYQNSNNIVDKLKSLQRNLTQIQAAIHAASQRQIGNPGLRTWLLNLKDACYDAERVLDMFEYQLIKEKIEGKNQGSSISATIQELFGLSCGIVKCSLFCDGKISELLKVADTFDKLVSQMGSFLYLLNEKEGESLKKMEKRSSTSISSEPKLFGRDKERTHLIELLQEGGGQNVHVLPIVGIGGVGKTSLVQSVYNDQSIIKKHFHVTAWVCVSNKFELRRLITEIIESASINRPADFHNLQSLDSVQAFLKRGLQGVRFLIVLDDVWDEMPDQWEKLVLSCSQKGSKLVVTTRDQKVANLVKTKEAMSR